ncbi:hypothetical protein ACHWQZ_G016578 [Mnemiopsis leidyi]
MNTSILLVTFVTLVTIGNCLRCYSGCGKSSVAGETIETPCDSDKKMDCAGGEVCASEKYGFKILGVSSEIEMKACTPKSSTVNVVCDALKEVVSKTGIVSDWECSVNFCETDLCNSGHTTRISLFVLVAGALFYGLF